MSDVVIRTENLGKQYRVGRRESYLALRDVLARSLRAPGRIFRRQSASASQAPNLFWALKDVSLQIKQGELLGVIGHNGAGKSTLLKILARVVKPTQGSAQIYGRVGSLLEVGTGFHSELSGRENIYFSGSILGMSKTDIKKRFDEIVAFAEVEKFLDTPVKHYSSGMHTRLGFAVAAHMEPTVLLVDEVLAVGDARFWTKCVEKMTGLNKQGMSIVVVSHNMWVVQTICERAMLMDRGKIVADGAPLSVIGKYQQINESADRQLRHRPREHSSGVDARMTSFQFSRHGDWTDDGDALPESGVKVSMEAEVSGTARAMFLIRIASPDGFPFFTVYSDVSDIDDTGMIECEAVIDRLMLVPGNYRLWGAICSERGEEQLLAQASAPFTVSGESTSSSRTGIVWNKARWQFSETAALTKGR
jgi:lipopolysaccharide transport system ATP-binding protein